jgi:hypothetical protein
MACSPTARPITAGALLAVVFFGTIAGCLSPRRVPPRPKPAELEPIQIDWSDPGSVVEGFFDAKKRGDWRKAYGCCDFEERLGRDEATSIRNEWKKEARTWPEAYGDSHWFIADTQTRGDYAIVSVVRVRRVGPGAMDAERTGFEELCKRYGDRWKMTEFEVMPR